MKNGNYTPECLRNLPRQQKPETRSKRRKEARAVIELAPAFAALQWGCSF